MRRRKDAAGQAALPIPEPDPVEARMPHVRAEMDDIGHVGLQVAYLRPYMELGTRNVGEAIREIAREQVAAERRGEAWVWAAGAVEPPRHLAAWLTLQLYGYQGQDTELLDLLEMAGAFLKNEEDGPVLTIPLHWLGKTIRAPEEPEELRRGDARNFLRLALAKELGALVLDDDGRVRL